jgi:hypothetical protein
MPRFAAPAAAAPLSKGADKAAAAQPRRADPQRGALWHAIQLKAAQSAASVSAAKAVRSSGLPGPLQTGIERLSGIAMDDVRVHRNSAEPGKIGALAYAKGSDIHLGPGQERHLPHEAWHVVQQKQGRVQATAQLKGAPLNDEAGLEREADAMGERALQTTEAARNATRAAPIQSPSAIQCKIVVAGANVTADDLAANLVPLLDDRAKRFLKPIYDVWMKEKGTRPADPAANYQALRTSLIESLAAGWTATLKGKLPKLHAFLPTSQFNTLVFMANLADFDAKPLEQALAAAQSSAVVEAKTLAGAFSPGKLPHKDVGYGIFRDANGIVDWAAQIPGVTGLTAELQVAAGVKPAEVLKGQKVGLSIDMQLGGKTIGGQTTQDADVSFTSTSGARILVEVAASVDRLQTKMGVGGDMQRSRYKRLTQVDKTRVLAFATPGAPWAAFFTGDPSIADRLPALDQVGWGLVIDGHYASPDELTAMSLKLRAAEPRVKGFWEALDASRLSYEDVRKTASADQLQKGLQKHVKH